MKSMMKNKAHERLLVKLYEEYAKGIYGIAFAILKNQSQAEDVVQETFLKIIPYLPRLETEKEYHVKGFLCRVAKNEAISSYRKNQKERHLYEEMDPAYEGHRDMKKDFAEIDQVENRHFIRQILKKLDSNSREITELRCFCELDYKEIAAVLEIGEDAAMKRFERAKQKVKNVIRDDYCV